MGSPAPGSVMCGAAHWGAVPGAVQGHESIPTCRGRGGKCPQREPPLPPLSKHSMARCGKRKPCRLPRRGGEPGQAGAVKYLRGEREKGAASKGQSSAYCWHFASPGLVQRSAALMALFPLVPLCPGLQKAGWKVVKREMTATRFYFSRLLEAVPQRA